MKDEKREAIKNKNEVRETLIRTMLRTIETTSPNTLLEAAQKMAILMDQSQQNSEKWNLYAAMLEMLGNEYKGRIERR